jgi:uncharacterized protein (DUF885 family)
VAVAAAATLLWGCVTTPPPPAPPPAPNASDDAFETVAVRYLTDMLALAPVTATQLGEHAFDDRLDDMSPAGRAQRADLARRLLAELSSIDAAQLSRAHQVDAQLLRHDLQYTLWQIEQLQEWRWNPLVYTDLAGSSIYQLLARDFAPLPVRLNAAAARLEALPRLLSQEREALDPARVPRIHAETAVQQNAGVLNLINEMIQPQLGALPHEDQVRLTTAIAHARSAISQQQIWLSKRLLPDARGEFRLGAELYDAKLRFELASSLSRTEIRTRADAELARARSDMYAIAREVLSGRADAPPLPPAPSAEEQQAAIAAALELAYAQQPARSKVFDTARQAFADAERFVRSKDLLTLYDDPLDIIPMPQYQRGVILAYCDAPGPLDQGQKTYYAVAPIPDEWTADQVKSYLREYNDRAIHELTIHEAMPGHYVQLAHANRYPSALRGVLQSGTFIEGWAVYAERLMSEQGYMNADPLMRLIQLKWYLRSIGNAILDQAVHVDGISREDAMRLMTHDTFQEEREAAAKWVRVQLTAAQLPTYFVGVQEHLALRDEAQRRWGKSFALKRYHDAVLSYGSPPVHDVRALMFDLPIEQ